MISIKSIKIGKEKQKYRVGATLNFPILIIQYYETEKIRTIYINPWPFDAQIPAIIKEVEARKKTKA